MKDFKERKKEFLSGSGIPIKRIYTPEDVEDISYSEDIGVEPGEPPFTRGVYPTMYRGRLWTIRRYSGTHTPEETNKLYKREYELGQTGFSIAADTPTGSGINSDHPIAFADVGVCGVPIDSLLDIKTMFEDLPIESVSTVINSDPMVAPAIAAMYFSIAQNRGLELAKLGGSCINDITTALSCIGYSFEVPPKPNMRLALDLIEWCVENVPKWHPVVFDSYNYREHDINAYQEIGLLLSTAIGYIEEAKERGNMPLDRLIRTFAFNMGCHNDFFEEIAKFRAARRMWYKIVSGRYGITDPRCCQLRFHVQSSGCTHTTQEPLNNLIRIAIQTLACVMGGAQSIHANSYEEGLCLPTEQGMLLSIRTEQILQHETNIVNTVDPLGGSYYIEWLTSELEKRAWDYIKKIEDKGGIVVALETGWIHNEFKKAMLDHEEKVDSGEIPVVGVNLFKLPEEPYKVPLCRANPNATDIQVEKLKKIRKERDDTAVQRILKKLRKTVKGDENVMPVLIEAVEEYATLQEICDIWRDVYGIWRIPMAP